MVLVMGYQTHCARLLPEFCGLRVLPKGRPPTQTCGIRSGKWEAHKQHSVHTNLVVSMYYRVSPSSRSFGTVVQNEARSSIPVNGAYSHQRRRPPIVPFQRPDVSNVDIPTLLSRIWACSQTSETLEEGIRIHRSIAYTELESDVHVGTALIHMYGKYGSLENARKILEKIADRNVETWTEMITALVENGREKAALQAFSQMQWEGVPPSKETLITVLRACTSPASLAEGKLIHSLIVENGFDSDLLVTSALIRMYGRCKSLDTAQEIFEKLVKKEVEAWNALIAAYGENGHEKKALELFNQMQQEGLVANKSTVLSILRALSGPASLAEGKLIHALIVERGLSLDIDVVNTLMHMYIKCDLVDEAQVLFERMPKKDLSSWNVLLGAFAHQSNGLRALEMFARMQREGFKGNKHTYVHLFNACANCALLAEGKQLHSSLFGTEWERDVLVSSALIYMYGKFSNLDEARQIFDRVPEKDVASWNAMIAAYANNGDGNKVAQLYDSMQKEGIKPTKHIFLNLLGAFVNPSQLAKAKIIHVHIIQNEYESDLAVGNALISMYGRCGDLQCALEIFNRMPERSTATWNAMIAACVQIGDSSMARKLFYQMPEEGMRYDKTTFVSILGACSSPEELVEGRNIHNLIREEGLELDVVVGTSLISMYDNCGSREEARQTFDKLSQRDVAAWNAIIATYAREGNQKVALELFKKMQQEDLEPDRFTFVNLLSACTTATSLEDGKFIQACAIEKGLETDVVVGTALVDMYGRCGTVADARQMFEKISHRDSSAWNTMVKLYIQNNLDKDALLLFKQMQLEGGRPNRTNLLGIFNVCAKLKVLSDAKMISTRLDDYEVDLDVEAGNVMVNMFVKCGSLQEAKEVFDKMLNRDAVTWSTLISAYAQEGSGKFALQLFAQMQQQGIKPNNASLANVLNAISNVGPLEEACDYFNSKIVDKGIQQSVQQYGSMVNLLGQKGRLDEAEDFIAKTPYKDDKAMWMALLGACRVHGDVDRGKRAAEKLLQLDPQTSAPYVMLSNIYASSGRWEAKARVRRVMAEKGIKKQPGISAIEVHGKMHEFMVRDRSHPRSKEIYAELERLTAAIKKAGYVPDTSQVLHNVASEKEKEWLLNTHSERLAICYGLITTPPGTPLRIIKNLRVCPDCHVATKFICKVTGRDIIVRDGKRFHHVSKDGTCSCNDYW